MAVSEAEALAHPAVVAHIAALTARFEATVAALQVEVQALRERLNHPPKTPENSSLPPAKGWQRAQRAAVTGAAAKRGPKAGHRGVSRSRVAAAQVDQVLVCRPQQCAACGTALPEHGGKVVGRQQVVELPPIRAVVVELQRLRVRCQHCGHDTVGCAPAGWDGQARFGPRVVALAALLHDQQHVAYERLVTLFAEVFGLRISEGAVVAAVARLGSALQPAAEAIAAAVRSAAVVGSDETSVRVAGRTWWAWVFQTAQAAVFRITPRRNADVLLSFLEGEQPGTWVSDLLPSQRKAPTQAYQICQAHQLRALRYAEQWETGEARQAERTWATQMAALIRQAIHLRNQQADAAFTLPAFVAAVAAIEAESELLLGQRLRNGESYRLQTRFLLHRAGLWTFLHDPAVPATNNRSEQALRPLVVHRKVTNGFRAEAAATSYAALRTVAETARRRDHSVFATLLQAAGAPLPLKSQPSFA